MRRSGTAPRCQRGSVFGWLAAREAAGRRRKAGSAAQPDGNCFKSAAARDQDGPAAPDVAHRFAKRPITVERFATEENEP
jgi:hypothetical protein